MFKVNSDNDTFKDIKNLSEENEEDKLDLKDKTNELQKYYSSAFTDHTARARLVKIKEKWNELEAKLFKQISDYTEVLQTVVFPSNKYTKKQPVAGLKIFV
jgi:hypothetical protein